MKPFILCALILSLSGCVATQRYSEETADLFSDFAGEVALEFPNNQHIQNIAKKAQSHAEEDGGFDFSGIVQLLAMLSGGGGTLGALGLAAAGVLSPGVKRKKKKKS